jgi:hypothetical protein
MELVAGLKWLISYILAPLLISTLMANWLIIMATVKMHNANREAS